MEDQLSFLPPHKELASQAPLPVLIQQWSIYVDGASRGNPGPSGAGIYILCGDHEVVQKGIYLGKKTNNQAEYLAVALAVFFLKLELKKTGATAIITITSDSELLVRQMQGRYAVKNSSLKSLKMLIDSELAHFNVSFKHVLREYNKVADKLANLGVDKKHPMPEPFKKLLISHGVELS